MEPGVDEVLALKNQFYLGAFQTVINEATNPATTPRTERGKVDRQVLLHRAYISHGRFNLVLSEITDRDPVELRAVRTLAKVLAAPAGAGREAAVAEAAALAESLPADANPVAFVVLGTVFYHDGRFDDALRLLVRAPKHLESIALAVQIYLKIDRPDLAKKELKALKAWADDATLAQLIEAWINIYSGGPDKYQEAFYIFEELANTSTATSKLLTCKANPNDPDTIANMIVTATALHKPLNVVNQLVSQLKDVAPNHPLAQELALKESLFDRAALRFAQA
ncbi:hypothetical protein HK105_204200 [Polyrhizophydium stewartii]|uniref:Coatomer subunit epsilon n=1 Tax=Polyrhizophydium stewartii TaxID=2732419 RepID=A0ABR4N9I4_9FUNG|nr:hypothetical protein HK105_006576 [Polyrhizophydium stewartii]